MSKKVCLITPSHLASNPRLIKEAIALKNEGYKVHLVFTQNLSYLIEQDKKILAQHPEWEYDVLNLSTLKSKQPILHYTKIFRQKLASFSLKSIPSLFAYHLSINRNYYWQRKKAVASKADLFIAHNLGALPVAYYAAKKNKVKCGFDAEDFHRAEVANINQKESEIKVKIEDYYIPKADYVTAASPLIAEKYHEIFKIDIPVILNVFLKTRQQALHHENTSLKLFWFSQTIGQNRGIEVILKALNQLDQNFEFHLLGNIHKDYKQEILSIINPKKANSIIFHLPINPDQIFEMSTNFDIGLASEPGFSINNNIALSNKIFTYLQTGLAILASDTLAQKMFMEEYPDIGFIYQKESPESLASAINQYANNRSLLQKHQQIAYQIGQEKLNWEIEQKKFLSIIKNLDF